MLHTSLLKINLCSFKVLLFLELNHIICKNLSSFTISIALPFCAIHHISCPQLSVLTVQVSVGMKNNSVWRYEHWKSHKGFTFVVTSYSYQSRYSIYYTRYRSSVQIIFGKSQSLQFRFPPMESTVDCMQP